MSYWTVGFKLLFFLKRWCFDVIDDKYSQYRWRRNIETKTLSLQSRLPLNVVLVLLDLLGLRVQGDIHNHQPSVDPLWWLIITLDTNILHDLKYFMTWIIFHCTKYFRWKILCWCCENSICSLTCITLWPETDLRPNRHIWLNVRTSHVKTIVWSNEP